MEDYNKRFDEYFNIKNKIIDPTKRGLNLSIKETSDNVLIAMHKNKEIKLQLPVYVDVEKKITVLKEQKRKLMSGYTILKNRILYEEDLNSKELEPEFNNIVKKLNEIHSQIKELEEIKEDFVQEKIVEKISRLNNEIRDINTQRSDILNKLKNNGNLNTSQINKLMNEYIELTTDVKIFNKVAELSEIKSFPIIPMQKIRNFDLSPETKKETVILPSSSVSNKKNDPEIIPIKKVNKEELNNNIKKIIIDNFPFEKQEECSTKKRSAKFFMSKENLVKIIEKNTELQKKLPKNFKKLSKDDLCNKLFN